MTIAVKRLKANEMHELKISVLSSGLASALDAETDDSHDLKTKPRQSEATTLEKKSKMCTRCGQDKSIHNFGRDTRRKDGLQSACRACYRQYDKIRRPKKPKREKKLQAPVHSKVCTRCHKEKSSADFGADLRRLSCLQSWCRACCKEDNKIRKENIFGRIEHLVNQAERNAKSRGLKGRIEAAKFDLTVETVMKLFLERNGRCAISGYPMSIQDGFFCVSIDRIDNTKGYTLANIRLVCRGFNVPDHSVHAKGETGACQWSPEKWAIVGQEFTKIPTLEEIAKINDEAKIASRGRKPQGIRQKRRVEPKGAGCNPAKIHRIECLLCHQMLEAGAFPVRRGACAAACKVCDKKRAELYSTDQKS
jgi:hypothetical protein